jgi:hypothetical protein
VKNGLKHQEVIMDSKRALTHLKADPNSDSRDCRGGDEEPPREKGYLIFRAYGVNRRMLSHDYVLNIVPLGQALKEKAAVQADA